ncbi:MAG TPA: hypothetical protein VKU85_06630 [bacterium]|nr:hypothetical protein [bacterium]
MKSRLLLACMGTVLGALPSAAEDATVPGENAIRRSDPTTMLALAFPEPVRTPEPGGNAPVLLASSASALALPIAGSELDTWNRVGRPGLEPTDPDRIHLRVIRWDRAESWESPWDAWENRDDGSPRWETLAPGDR